MAGTRILGDRFQTTDEGLQLHGKLLKTERTEVLIDTGTLIYTVRTIKANANVTRIIVVMPSLTADDVTAILSITNSDGDVIYESYACDENGVNIIAPNPAVPLVGTNTIILTLNKDSGGSGTAYASIYLEGGK